MPTNPFSITNIHGSFYKPEEGQVDASFENNTLIALKGLFLYSFKLRNAFKYLLLCTLKKIST